MTTQTPASNSEARKRAQERARSAEYTPTTGEVRYAYVDRKGFETNLRIAEVDDDAAATAFDRWLAAHDAEVAAKAKAEEREAAAARVMTVRDVCRVLRARADEIDGDAND